MRQQRQRIESRYIGEEVAVGAGCSIVAGLRFHRLAEIGLVWDEAGRHEEIIELGGLRLGHPAIDYRLVNWRDRRQVAIAHFLQPQRRQRAIKLALEERRLLVPSVGREIDVRDIPVVIRLTDARGADLLRGLGGDPVGEAVGGGLSVAHCLAQRRTCTGERRCLLAGKSPHLKIAAIKRRKHLALLTKGAIPVEP